MDIDSSTLVRRDNSALFTDLGDEVVMMDVETGTYFNTRHVGTRIWTMIETQRSIGEICETLTQEYDVDAEACTRETVAFISSLRDAGLVVVE